jgi:hypothetical protein
MWSTKASAGFKRYEKVHNWMQYIIHELRKSEIKTLGLA